MENINKVLVIRFSSLGDIVLLSCLFREIKTLWPGTKIDFVTYAEFSRLYEECPHLNNIITCDRNAKRYIIRNVCSTIKKQRYDLVIDAHNTFITSILKFINIWNVKQWSTVKKYVWLRLLIVHAKIDKFKKPLRAGEKYLNTLSKLCDVTKLNLKSEIHISEKTISITKKKLNLTDGKKYVAVIPGASSVIKSWPVENYAAVCRVLANDYQILILGGQKDMAAERLASMLPGKAKFLAGKLDLLETCAVLKLCAYSITNDSGGLHLSEAVNTPVIAMFGPTTYHFGFYPQLKNSVALGVDIKCRPCSKNGRTKCKNINYLECLKSISPNWVIKEAIKLAPSSK